MEKYEEININTALKQIPDIYKMSLEYIYDSLLPEEKVLFVGTLTEHTEHVEKNWSDFWSEYKEKTTYTNTPSLLIITNQRWIRKWTRCYDDYPQTVLSFSKKEKQKFFYSVKDRYCWIEPRKTIPETHFERNGKTLQEWASSNIRYVPLKEIILSEKRICFSNNENIKKTYLQIRIDKTYYTFEPNDGEKVFTLLQLAATNGGKIQLETKAVDVGFTQNENIAQRLKIAQELFENQIITESEYQQKRQQILSEL